jgi:hypothetical protein
MFFIASCYGIKMKRLLFVCVENAGRSQMAEAFARHQLADPRLNTHKKKKKEGDNYQVFPKVL